LLLTACSQSQPGEQKSKLALSSIATAVRVMDERLNHAVPRAYARRTLEAMTAQISDALSKQSDTTTSMGRSEASTLAQQALDILRRSDKDLEYDNSEEIIQAREALHSIVASSRSVDPSFK
jgi:hypothetical protein